MIFVAGYLRGLKLSPSTETTVSKENTIMKNRIKQKANRKPGPNDQSSRLAKAAKATKTANNKPWLNSEGYRDPTAYAALRNIQRAERR